MSTDDADIEAAMRAVVEDMGQSARKFKARRYTPKPAPVGEKAAETAPAEDESGMPTAGELEAMLTEG